MLSVWIPQKRRVARTIVGRWAGSLGSAVCTNPGIERGILEPELVLKRASMAVVGEDE